MLVIVVVSGAKGIRYARARAKTTGSGFDFGRNGRPGPGKAARNVMRRGIPGAAATDRRTDGPASRQSGSDGPGRRQPATTAPADTILPTPPKALAQRSALFAHNNATRLEHRERLFTAPQSRAHK